MSVLKIFAGLIILFTVSTNACFAVEFFAPGKSDPPIELGFPVLCNYEENCWIVNYPDNGSIQDYKGGKITYKNNKGVDIAVKTVSDLKNGIPVISAQDGEVVFVRNDVPDNYPLGPENASEEPPFYGNAVVIEHNNGWKTAYFHLKKGSIRVKPGDFAGKGKKIARMGLSGNTNFPCLHFAVIYDKSYFDPFSGLELANKEKLKQYKPFWSASVKETLKYREVIIPNIGVSQEEPSLFSIKEGKYEDIEIMNDTPELFFWVRGFHFIPNDLIKINLINPEQKLVLDSQFRIKSNKIEQVVSFKKPKEDQTWVPGIYMMKIEFYRPGLKLVYGYDFDFEIKKPPEPVDKEALKKEEQLKKLKLKRRKVIIFHKLKQEEKLPDTYKENKFKFEFLNQ